MAMAKRCTSAKRTILKWLSMWLSKTVGQDYKPRIIDNIGISHKIFPSRGYELESSSQRSQSSKRSEAVAEL